MKRWPFTKGLHDLGNGCFAYLQPDGGWGLSNAGLVVDGGETLHLAHDARQMIDMMKFSKRERGDGKVK